MRKILLWSAVVALGALFVFRLYQHFVETSLAGMDGGSAAPFAGAGRPGAANGKARPAGGGGGGFPGRAQLVDVAEVQRATAGENLSLVGSLRAREQVDVSPKVSGRLVELRVDRGDRVSRGQAIARIEDDEIQEQVRRAEAALQVARAARAQREAELRSAEVDRDRLESLHREGVIASQQLEQAETQVDVARAQVQVAAAQVAQAEAELAELQIRLSQTGVVSPLDGVVGRRWVDPGAMVTSTTPLVTVLDLSRMVTVVNVPERDLLKLEAGGPARVSLDAAPERELEGKIVRISPLLNPDTRTAEVEIEIPNTSGRLKAEMFARVSLSFASDREILVIPRDALVYRDAQSGVFVIQSGKAEFRPIETGAAREGNIEVLSGLKEGETVVARGANLLRDGDAVQALGPKGY